MELAEVRERLEAIEERLGEQPFIELAGFERAGRLLHLCITQRLHREARRAKMWKSKGMLSALRNARYGFDPEKARSSGGRDGIFILDRDFHPSNEMIRRIYGYLDRAPEDLKASAVLLGAGLSQLQAVRLVSHHTRLLGFLYQNDQDWLVLVDVDPTKRAS